MQFTNYNLELHGVRLPQVELDESLLSELGGTKETSHDKIIRQLCLKNLDEKIAAGYIDKTNKALYIKRIETELEVIVEGGFEDYMLLVWDIIKYVRDNKIPKGEARGSAAGCLILYLLQVTGVDPLIHELYFERFLSRARIKKTIVDGITYLDGSLVPDVDMDLSNFHREQVINYVLDKYKGHSCKLSTVSTLQGKILIKECGKIVGGFNEMTMTEISSLIPSVFGKVKDPEDAYKEVKEFQAFCDENPEVYKVAKSLKGLIKNKGSHASGYLISYFPLDKYVPVELGTGDEIVSSYDMRDAQDVAIKVDLLGLQDVTLMYRVAERVGEDIQKIKYDDPSIYNHLKCIEAPYGIFQLGADTNLRVSNKVKPRNLSEVSSVVAIARPGALAYVDQFAKYVETGEFQSVHSFFDDILQETGGVPLMQEQCMRMMHKLGFTLEEAEIVRRIIGKKKEKEMAEWKEKIQKKIADQKLDPKIGEVLWKVMDDSKSYSFNKSHSVSYAILAVRSIYLKSKYPADFFIESLKMAREKSDAVEEINVIQKELQYYNIRLLPPDLVKSDLDFRKEGDNIRYGLSAIKGISDKSINKLKDFLGSTRASKFQVFQAAKNSGLSVGIVSALIQAGLMDTFGHNRPRLVYEAQLYSLLTDRERTWCLTNEDAFKSSMFDILTSTERKELNGKEIFKASRMATLKKDAEDFRTIFKRNGQFPEYAAYYFETKVLGFSYSHKLCDVFSSYGKSKVLSLINAKSLLSDERASLVGMVTEIKKKKSKAGKDYYSMFVEDESCRQEFLIFKPEEIENKGLIPKENDVVVLEVRKWNDALVINDSKFHPGIQILTDKIYMKFAEIKNEEKNKTQKIS